MKMKRPANPAAIPVPRLRTLRDEDASPMTAPAAKPTSENVPAPKRRARRAKFVF